ncbi:MAG: large subunit ribosomal protein L25 [Cellvibrionaceae bacterium]|jgi:large subunit ribosomal protein L25
MSKEDFVIDAQNREDAGKGASRRLRRQALVPAIVYGGNKEPQSISILSKELIKHLENEAFYSHIVSINIAGKIEDVILKDLQRHPAKPVILHADFLRVLKDQKLTTKVPLHFINEAKCAGVKNQGGIVNHSITELEIVCLPADLPEYIEVDLIDLEIGNLIHISDLTLPKGVESVDLAHGEVNDLTVAAVTKPKGIKDGDDESGDAPEDSE